jgi:hypothetical protein
MKGFLAGPPEQQAAGAGAEWFTPGRFALILAACIFAAYPEIVLGMQTFFFRDFGFFGYPLAFHLRESFWSGEIPLWNPLNNCGLPFLAQWNTMVLYPGSLFYILLPLSWSLGLFCLLHQYLAGLGMYFLAYRWTRSRPGAAVAGMVFAFNGLTLNCLMWPNNIAALGWMPWVVLLIDQALRQGGRKLTQAIVVGAMQMLAGAPEIILFTWTLVVILFVAELGRHERKRLALTRRFGLLVSVVAGLAAIQLLPFLDLLTHSQRDTNFAQSSWSMPGTGWANFFVPLFHCFSANQGVFFQYDQWWTSSYYLGVGPMGLALCLSWRVQTLRATLLTLLTVSSLVLALGDDGYAYRWLRLAVPQFGFLRFPIKFVLIAVFCLPLLAAYAFTRLDSLDKANSASRLPTLAAIWIGISAMIAAILWFEWRYPFPFDQWEDVRKNSAFREVFFTIFVALLAVVPRIRNNMLRPLLTGGLLFVVWLDLITHAPRQNPTVPRAVYEPGLLRLAPAPGHGVNRAMISPWALLRLRGSSVTSELNDYLGSRLALRSNCNLLDGIPKIDGFFSLYLREANRICELLYFSTLTNAPALLDFLSVAHVTAPGKLFDWELRGNYLPFITAGQQPIFADEHETLKAILSPEFAPSKVVYLTPDSKSSVTVTPSSTRVRADHFSAHREEITVEAHTASMVVISQAYYHRWNAYVDDQRTRIWRANYAFQAVYVPPGRHQITLYFSDPFFQIGAALSATVLIGLGFVEFWRQRTPLSPYDQQS